MKLFHIFHKINKNKNIDKNCKESFDCYPYVLQSSNMVGQLRRVNLVLKMRIG